VLLTEMRATHEIPKRLLPGHPVVLVTDTTTVSLNESELSVDAIGQKAVGLSAIPLKWTLPYVCVSRNLHEQFVSSRSRREKLLAEWGRRIIAAAIENGIQAADRVLIRSSGCTEEMSGRGKFYSTGGTLENMPAVLHSCLEKLASDPELKLELIPLIVQKCCQPLKARGHLSNERRCYEEHRDWMGEFEAADKERSASFQINLRRWRERKPLNLTEPLLCAISPRISEVLKIPAQWATSKKARVHYEWVWDGSKVYIVQADEERSWTGHDPVEEHAARQYNSVSFKPRCVKAVTKEDAKRFGKIRNVFT
jgi:hypothetical protein